MSVRPSSPAPVHCSGAAWWGAGGAPWPSPRSVAATRATTAGSASRTMRAGDRPPSTTPRGCTGASASSTARAMAHASAGGSRPRASSSSRNVRGAPIACGMIGEGGAARAPGASRRRCPTGGARAVPSRAPPARDDEPMQRAPFVSFPVRPPDGRRPAARDVVEGVLSELRAGRLPPGARLPPVRALERQLGMSKNTVQAAYDELVARGVVEAREREGVFVAIDRDAPAVEHVAARPPLPVLRPPPPVGPGRVPDRGISLSTVFIEPALLPADRIAECARSVLRGRMSPWYDVQGHPGLREAIAARLRRRGLDV